MNKPVLDETASLSWPFRLVRGLGSLFRLGRRNGTIIESIEEILEESGEDGGEQTSSLASDQKTLIANVLSAGSKTVQNIMVPRADIDALDVGASLDEVIDFIAEHMHSRYPLYSKTVDRIVGVVNVKTVMHWLSRNRDATPPPFFLRQLAKKPLFVAPSMRALDLLLHMRETRQHMALVVDEYGGTDGLVTIEDAVEEIVGDIKDEYNKEETPDGERLGDGSILVDARMRVEEFQQRFAPSFTPGPGEEDIDTLGGLVFSAAGRVPDRGEVIGHPASKSEFGIIASDPRRIYRLRVRLPKDDTEHPGDEQPKGEHPGDEQPGDKYLEGRHPGGELPGGKNQKQKQDTKEAAS